MRDLIRKILREEFGVRGEGEAEEEEEGNKEGWEMRMRRGEGR